MQLEYLKKLEDQNLITLRKHPLHDVYVANYTPEVQFNRTWNKDTIQCRGLVVNEERVLARPFKKFFNYSELQGLRNFIWNLYSVKYSEIFNKPFTAYEKLDGCFHWSTPILMSDGKYKTLKEIFNNQNIDQYVLGYDQVNKKIIKSKILNYFRNGDKDNWIYVTTNNKFAKSGGGKGVNNINRLIVTDNQKFYNGNNFQPIKDFKVGDDIYCYKMKMNPIQKQCFLGSLIGDSSISLSTNLGILQGFHKEEHIEYVNLKRKILGNLCIDTNYNRISGFGSIMYPYVSIGTEEFFQIRNEWYKNSIKQIPDLSWFTPLSFAFWYMDDGSLSHSEYQQDRICLSTNAFNKIDCEKLANKLIELYPELSISIYENKGYNIRINYSDGIGINKLWKDIHLYFPICMQYKLPEKYRTGLPSLLDNISYYCDEILECRKILSIEKCEKKYEAFDIETETHNFFAKGVLVHNSLGIFFRLPNGKWEWSTRGSFESEQSDIARSIFKYKYQLSLNPNYTYLFEIIYPENRIVVDYHGECDLYLLSIIETSTGRELTYDEINRLSLPFPRPKVYNDILSLTQAELQVNSYENFEGFVLDFGDGFRCKIKSNQYVHLHRIVTQFTPRRVFDALRNGTLDNTLKDVPDEFYNEVNEVKNQILIDFDDILNSSKEYFNNIKFSNRKEFAEQANKFNYPSILFLMLDNKDYVDQIWKILEKNY